MSGHKPSDQPRDRDRDSSHERNTKNEESETLPQPTSGKATDIEPFDETSIFDDHLVEDDAPNSPDTNSPGHNQGHIKEDVSSQTIGSQTETAGHSQEASTYSSSVAPDEVIPGGLQTEEADTHINPNLPSDEDDPAEFIEEIDASQEYIRITPVREEVNSETVTRELYGLHRYGSGRKLPLDMELHIDSIEPVSNFEFLIYKPEGEAQFEFYIGPGERGDVNVDRLESTTRSQYPENFEFNRKNFDITSVFEDIPHMVRYEGVEERRKDWMTVLTRFDTESTKRSQLSNLLETIIQSDGAVLFQVVFEPRSDWSPKAQRHKGRLKQGVHTAGGMVVRTVMDSVLGVSDEERQERHRGETPQEIGGTIMDSQADGQRTGTSRMAQIDLKNPSHTYNVTVRAATQNERCAINLQDSLNQLSGQFYSIDGNYLGCNENEYKRMINHGLTYPNGWEMVTRRKPILVCNIEELASFITVPSIDALPKASRGGTGGKPKAQSALTSPNEEVFREFSNGMTIGHAVTALRDTSDEEEGISAIESVNEWWNKLDRRDALALSAGDLTHHYIRAATTGSGKTVATLNDMLTSHHNLDGPLILIDPKGGEMCRNYLRCHRTLFGDLENVEYIQIPEDDGKIPGIPFFDLRPLVRAAGRTRETAKQDIIDHYFQLLRFVLGRDTVEQAFVANEILTNLIKALFDEQYGSDYFTVGDLLEAAQRFQHYGREVENVESNDTNIEKAIPPCSDEQVKSILESHLEKEERQFMNTTDAVLNRIRKLKERDFIWDMLSFEIPDKYWDDDKGWYDRTEVPMLDLKNVLNTNKVLLIDTGSLRGESSEVFTVLFLSHLWTSVQSIWTPDDDDYIANVIIEESANIARNEIVYRELLPKGREFNLSLGLIMQYPEQVLGEDPRANRRAYQEILNNVNTKIIGNIATDDLLADSLFHEDLDRDEIKDRIAGLRRGEWVVQLPSTGFHKQKPEILTLKPLPIPPGHSEGPFDVSPKTNEVRKRSRDLHCLNRDHEHIKSDSSTFKFDDNDEDEDVNDELEDKDIDIGDGELEWKHISFLNLVFDALTDGAKNYNLGQSMTELPFSEVAKELEEWEFLEKVTLAQNKVYYFPTKDAEIVAERSLSPENGGELGDESPEHRLGTIMAATYYEQLGYKVELYADINNGSNKVDVLAKPDKSSPDDRRKLIEVETSPEKKGHVLDDYLTLKEGYGDGIWVVKNTDAAKTLLSKLSEEVEDIPSGHSHDFDKVNEELNDTGAKQLHTLNSLRKTIE